MEQPDHLALTRILEALDSSIQTAVANPASAGVESLQRAEALCRHLALNDAQDFGNENGLHTVITVNSQSSGKTVELLWEIRARLGRLKMLLDAAAVFYRGLASSPSAGVDYDVQGEWMERPGGSLLQLDC
jgi:hypothetical protein